MCVRRSTLALFFILSVTLGTAPTPARAAGIFSDTLCPNATTSVVGLSALKTIDPPDRVYAAARAVSTAYETCAKELSGTGMSRPCTTPTRARQHSECWRRERCCARAAPSTPSANWKLTGDSRARSSIGSSAITGLCTEMRFLRRLGLAPCGQSQPRVRPLRIPPCWLAGSERGPD